VSLPLNREGRHNQNPVGWALPTLSGHLLHQWEYSSFHRRVKSRQIGDVPVGFENRENWGHSRKGKKSYAKELAEKKGD
jgi:hypothetical protein